MPKVYIGEQSRKEAEELRRNEVFSERLRTVYGRMKKTDVSVCCAANVSKSGLYKIKNPENVGAARFGTIRAVAHEVGMTAGEWLRLGGFEK